MSTQENTKYKSSSEDIKRQFKPTFIAIKNKTTVFILTILLVVFGLYSYRTMPRELYPEIVIPYIMVSTPYPGNSPLDIENLITRPIEKELKGLKGVKDLNSASYQDMSLIILEFETNVAVKQALQDTKDQVDKAKSELPDNLEQDPIVEDLDFAEFPIMNINLSGDYSLVELKKFAEKLQDQLETLSEISEADIKGIDEREIQINVDPHLLEANGVSFQDIENAIRFENITMGAGEIISGKARRSIRTQADYINMQEIQNTIIKSEDGVIVYLRDVGEVIDGFEERTSVSRLNNKPVVSLSVVKKSGANILAATDNVYDIINLNKKSGTFPPNLDIIVTNDFSDNIRAQISNLENSIIMGMIFVMLILYIFMGPRNALFSGLAIPMSMFTSFIIISWMGYTLNFMILFSMILALGMLVDNAIVVIENVYRLYTEGADKITATQKGVSEIAFPIISSTATTLAAFIPLIFWDGIMGEFMKYLPITLIIVLSSSLFVALILNPAFTATFMEIENLKGHKNIKRMWIITVVITLLSATGYITDNILWGNIFISISLLILINNYVLRPTARVFQGKALPRMEKIYEKALKYALKRHHPWLFLLGTVFLLIFSIGFFSSKQTKVLFFPENEPQSVYITMELPIGTDLEKTDEVSRKIETKTYAILEPYKKIVKSVNTIVGAGKTELFSAEREPNKSLTTITFIDYQYREGVNTSDVMKDLTEGLTGTANAKISVEKDKNGPQVGNPINIEVSGDDFDKLLTISSEVRQIIDNENIAGIDGLKFDINVDKPEMRVNVKREMVRRFGLSTQQVAYALRSALYGREIGKFKDGEDEYDIMLRLSSRYRNDVSSLMNQKLTVNGGGGNGPVKKVPISSVADFEYGTTYDKINRKDNHRVVTIYSQVKEGFNANEINDRIRLALKNYNMPSGYKIEFTGEQEEQDKTSAFLLRALLIAVSLILLIMVTQFNSLIRPLIIGATVLFSTIGVFLGLASFNMEFIILMTGIGIISLAGIVVNNGIVLIDYIDLLRNRHKRKKNLPPTSFLPVNEQIETIVEAGKTRLRPVLLTAITTVLGLLPLAVGLNFDFVGLYNNFDPDIYFGGPMNSFWSPMAWTVIFGLVFATFLTLIIAPVMYIITIKVNYFFKSITGKLSEVK
jgi:multidrug efflux pump subunit AcrB